MDTRKVAGYEVLETLKDQGALAVHLAREAETSRVVILETLSPALFSSRGRSERWLTQARSLRKLRHPHLAAVLDADRCGSTFYVAREWVPGQTLADLLDAGWTFDVVQTARIGAAVAEALAFLHRNHRAHGALCPRNLLLGTEGEIRLAGLGGLSIVAEREQTYLAPEVLAGQKPGPAADVYSLGAILRELYQGAGPASETEAAPGTPLPDPFAALIHMLTAENPEQRPASILLVAETLHTMVRKTVPPPQVEPEVEETVDLADLVAELNLPLTTYVVAPQETPAQQEEKTVRTRGRRRKERLRFALTTLCLLLAVVGAGVARARLFPTAGRAAGKSPEAKTRPLALAKPVPKPRPQPRKAPSPPKPGAATLPSALH